MSSLGRMIQAASESLAQDDEGEFQSLGDLIGFSGENKTRTVLRHALLQALRALDDGGLGDCPNFCAGEWSRRNLEAIIDDLESSK